MILEALLTVETLNETARGPSKTIPIGPAVAVAVGGVDRGSCMRVGRGDREIKIEIVGHAMPSSEVNVVTGTSVAIRINSNSNNSNTLAQALLLLILPPPPPPPLKHSDPLLPPLNKQVKVWHHHKTSLNQPRS